MKSKQKGKTLQNTPSHGKRQAAGTAKTKMAMKEHVHSEGPVISKAEDRMFEPNVQNIYITSMLYA